MAGKLSGSAIQSGTITSTQLSGELGPVTSELQLVGSGVSLNVSNNAVFSGNVGIGTSSPTQKLDIIGNIRILSESSSTILTNGANFTTGAIIDSAILRNSGNLLFGIGVTEQFRLDGSGNVGIGTTNPTGKLHVAGSIVQTTNADAFFSQDIRLSRATRATIYPSVANQSLQISSSGTGELQLNHDPGFTGNIIMAAGGGSVGIGVGPLSKLYIQGTGITTSSTTVNSHSLRPSSIFLYDAGNGSATDSMVGYFGSMAGDNGLSAGMGIARQSSANWGTQLRFYTHKTATSDINELIERMRIDGDSNIIFSAHLERNQLQWNGSPDSYSPGQGVNQTSSIERHTAYARKDLGIISTRAYHDYMDFKTNIYSDNVMFMFEFIGYQYSVGLSHYYCGGYTYLGGVIAKAVGTGYISVGADYVYDVYRATDGALCVKLYIGNQGYTEGRTHVFFNAFDPGIVRSCQIIASAVYNTTNLYY